MQELPDSQERDLVALSDALSGLATLDARSNVEGRARPAFALARYARSFGEVRRSQERSDCLAKTEVRLA